MNLPALTEQIQTIVGADVDGVWGVQSATKTLTRLRTIGVPTPTFPPVVHLVSARSEKVIQTLLVQVQDYMRSLIHVAATHNMIIEALSGFRSFDEQNALFAKGPRYTRARGGESGHNYGIACDFGIFVNNRYIDDDPSFSTKTIDAMYSALGMLGRSIGLSWGGNWVSFQDMPHFYLKPSWAKELSEQQMMAELLQRHNAGEDLFV